MIKSVIKNNFCSIKKLTQSKQTLSKKNYSPLKMFHHSHPWAQTSHGAKCRYLPISVES